MMTEKRIIYRVNINTELFQKERNEFYDNNLSITRKNVGDIVGLSRNTVNNILKGNPCSKSTLLKLRNKGFKAELKKV